MITLTNTVTFELIIELIKVLIWPITLIVIIFLFKHQLKGSFERITKLKADQSGIEIDFIAKKLAEAKGILRKLGARPVVKSTKKELTSGNSFASLQELKVKIEGKLATMAKEAGITPSETNIELCNQLKIAGVLLLQDAKLVKVFFEITNTANKESFNATQLQEVQLIYDQIEAL